MVGNVALISYGGAFGGPFEAERGARLVWCWEEWGPRLHFAPIEDECG